MNIFAVSIVTTKANSGVIDIKPHLFIREAVSSMEALGASMYDVNATFKDRQIASFCVSDAIKPDNEKVTDEQRHRKKKLKKDLEYFNIIDMFKQTCKAFKMMSRVGVSFSYHQKELIKDVSLLNKANTINTINSILSKQFDLDKE